MKSGVYILRLISSLAFVVVLSSRAIIVIGYYMPFLIRGSMLISASSGLLYAPKLDASAGIWVRYQILYAAGIGMSLEQHNIAI